MRRPAFRLVAPEPSELDLHAAAADALDRWLGDDVVWFSYPAGHVRLAPAELARLSRIGLKRGLPDIFVLWKTLYCIELKRYSGQLSKSRIGRTAKGGPKFLIGQDEMFPRLIRSGAVAGIAVCTSVEAMMAQLSLWGVPLKGLWGKCVA